MLEIQIMYKQGNSLKKISRETGYSINTVRKYIGETMPPTYKPRPVKISKLETYKAYLQERIEQAKPHWIPAIVLLQEIKMRGYSGEISLLRNYLQSLKPVTQERSFIRFETEPGEQMQVDFAHSNIPNNRSRIYDCNNFIYFEGTIFCNMNIILMRFLLVN